MRTARRLVTVMGGGKTYAQRILALSPYAYWPLDDAAGATAAREVVNGWTTTDCDNVTFGVEGIGGGQTAARIGEAGGDGFRASAAAMTATFPADEGTFMVWIKLSAAVWIDGKSHSLLTCTSTDATANFYIEKRTGNNTMRYHRRGGNATVAQEFTESRTNWMLFAQTWSVSGNALKGYINGVQVGTTQTNVLAWGAAVLNGIWLLRNDSGGGLGGDAAHVALFSRALTTDELLGLATL